MGNRQSPRRDWVDHVGFLSSIIATVIAGSAAFFTFYQARISKDTATRQLRAYVSIESAQLHIDMPSNSMNLDHINAPVILTVVAKIKNFGQTPSYKTMAYQNSGTAPSPQILPSGTKFPPLRSEYNNPIVLFPGTTEQIQINFTIKNKEDVYEVFSTGRLRFYFFGKVNYEDAFGNSRHTDFCYMMGALPFKDNLTELLNHNMEIPFVSCPFDNSAN